jgi:hypothetical protein
MVEEMKENKKVQVFIDLCRTSIRKEYPYLRSQQRNYKKFYLSSFDLTLINELSPKDVRLNLFGDDYQLSCEELLFIFPKYFEQFIGNPDKIIFVTDSQLLNLSSPEKYIDIMKRDFNLLVNCFRYGRLMMGNFKFDKWYAKTISMHYSFLAYHQFAFNSLFLCNFYQARLINERNSLEIEHDGTIFKVNGPLFCCLCYGAALAFKKRTTFKIGIPPENCDPMSFKDLLINLIRMTQKGGVVDLEAYPPNVVRFITIELKIHHFLEFLSEPLSTKESLFFYTNILYLIPLNIITDINGWKEILINEQSCINYRNEMQKIVLLNEMGIKLEKMLYLELNGIDSNIVVNFLKTLTPEDMTKGLFTLIQIYLQSNSFLPKINSITGDPIPFESYVDAMVITEYNKESESLNKERIRLKGLTYEFMMNQEWNAFNFYITRHLREKYNSNKKINWVKVAYYSELGYEDKDVECGWEYACCLFLELGTSYNPFKAGRIIEELIHQPTFSSDALWVKYLMFGLSPFEFQILINQRYPAALVQSSTFTNDPIKQKELLFIAAQSGEFQFIQLYSSIYGKDEELEGLLNMNHWRNISFFEKFFSKRR